MLYCRVRRHKTLHLLGNLETGKSKKEFVNRCAFELKKVVAATRCHKKPQKATESHKNKSESRRQLATKTTIGHSWKQKATKGELEMVRDKNRQLETVETTRQRVLR